MASPSLVGVDEKPVLLPVNAYTDEVIQKQSCRGGTSSPRAIPAMTNIYAPPRPTAWGNFAFHNGVPPGNYYLVSGVESSHWIWNTDQDGNLYKITIVNRTPLFARISVQNGQTVRVTDWTRGQSKEL